jgi:hypothetical protein
MAVWSSVPNAGTSLSAPCDVDAADRLAYGPGPMAFVTQFDTPGSLRDVPAGHPFYTDWSNLVASQLPLSNAGVIAGEFFDPSESNFTPAATRSLVWMGFPRAQMVVNHRDDRDAAFAACESRDVQEEYLEWRVTRNAAGKIRKVVFVTETPEYWERLALADRAKVLNLYRSLVGPAVTEADLFPGGTYDRRNRWNTTDGIVHYIQAINTLGDALGLASGAVDAPGANGFQMGPIRATSADPRVVLDIATIARKGLAVTLREPIGLYMTGWDDTGWTKPDGTPVGDYWRVTRGVSGAALRLEYEVPAGEGFVVGDIRIGGRPIKWGGQIAEHVTVMVGGIAGTRTP